MVIRIEQGKGRKDRYVRLSPCLHAVLQEYALAVHPHTVLFLSRAGGGPLSPLSIHRLFLRAKARAHIGKHVYPYSLRHAYATHLLEGGANLRVIQQLLATAACAPRRSTPRSPTPSSRPPRACWI